MKVKRYQAASSREAFAQVKKDLGADAVILSNRKCGTGVEILALAQREIGEVARPKIEQPLREFAKKVAAPVPAPDVHAELKAMRALVEHQLAALTWTDAMRRDPLRAQLARELIAAGFSAPLARKVAAGMPAGQNAAAAQAWLRQVLRRNLACLSDPAERGGVLALVGPTGVGKTTTVAKIAARCVVRFGADSVALVSSDGYRIGAQDQLRSYAAILGVPVRTVQDAAGLEQALAAFAGRRLVLVDTVGMGQRDARLAGQLELLADRRVQRLLLLNAACQIETLEEVARAYGVKLGAQGLAGAIVTKLDEARRCGGALDVAMRHRLPLAYVADGQRVPEDLRAADAAALLERALGGAAESPFALRDAEILELAAGERRAA